MFTSFHRQTMLTSLRICLVLGLLLLPVAISAAPAYALRADAAPNSQSGSQDDNVVILNEVQNPDGTTTTTVRIYATPNNPNAPNTLKYVSQDTFIAHDNLYGNYGGSDKMGIGYSSSGGYGAMRMLIQYDLSGIPSYATVNSAVVYIYQYAAYGISDMGFQAQLAYAPWNEYNATWDNANNIGGAKLPLGNFPNSTDWLHVNATNLFRTWVSGDEPNYGLIMTGYEDPGSNSSRWFRTSNSSYRPYVDISYTTGCSYTVDPDSSVLGLPATSPNEFTVKWTGTAYTPPGCAANGISSYIVWYQVNNKGDFIKWLDGVSYTSAQFNASSKGIGNGSVVSFRSQAIDYYGNKTPAGNATASTTINSVNPTVAMTALSAWTTTPNFTVRWTGNTQGGPAITSYNFEENINNGGWHRLLSNTPQTSFQYSGANGNNYQFRAQASNNGGASFGPWSTTTSTTVDTAAPSTTMDPLDQYTTSSSFWVSWSGSDPGGSGIAYYNLQYQFKGGSWLQLASNIPQPPSPEKPSYYFQNAQTGPYAFRVQAIDKAGNVQAWPANAQTSTTVLLDPLAVVQPFNPPILQSTAPITKSFNVSWKGYTPPGTTLTGYTVKYRYNSGPWLVWSTFPPAQTSAAFNWFDVHLPDEAIYQFQATASNNVNQPPIELPSQYWQTMIVDMQDRYRFVYLPIVPINASTP